MHKYKVRDSVTEPLVLVGVGTFEPGQEFQSNQAIENVHVQYLGKAEQQTGPVIQAVVQPSAGRVTNAQPINTNEETK